MGGTGEQQKPVCPSCGAEVGNDAFCSKCGTRLQAEEPGPASVESAEASGTLEGPAGPVEVAPRPRPSRPVRLVMAVVAIVSLGYVGFAALSNGDEVPFCCSGGSAAGPNTDALAASVVREYRDYLAEFKASDPSSDSTTTVHSTTCERQTDQEYQCTIVFSLSSGGITTSPAPLVYPVEMTSDNCWTARRNDRYADVTTFSGCITDADTETASQPVPKVKTIALADSLAEYFSESHGPGPPGGLGPEGLDIVDSVDCQKLRLCTVHIDEGQGPFPIPFRMNTGDDVCWSARATSSPAGGEVVGGTLTGCFGSGPLSSGSFYPTTCKLPGYSVPCVKPVQFSATSSGTGSEDAAGTAGSGSAADGLEHCPDVHADPGSQSVVGIVSNVDVAGMTCEEATSILSSVIESGDLGDSIPGFSCGEATDRPTEGIKCTRGDEAIYFGGGGVAP